MAVYPQGKDQDPSWELHYTDPVTGDRWFKPRLPVPAPRITALRPSTNEGEQGEDE